MDIICKHFNDCGGCDSQDKEYKEQLAAKKKALEELFKDTAACAIEDVIPSPEIWYYRNKMEYAVKRFEGNDLIGLRKKKRFYRVVDLDECRIFHRGLRDIFAAVKGWIRDAGIEPYDLFRHTGELKYIALRHSRSRDKLMVIAVAAAAEGALESEKAKYKSLAERLKGMPEVSSIYLCVNNGVADVAVTDNLILLSGEDSLKEDINNVEYRIRPASFFQTNPSCCARLYDVIRQEAKRLSAKGRAIDLYCGSGGITLQLASVLDNVTGVDISPQNIDDARESARLNNIGNADFICEDAEAFLLRSKEAGSLGSFSTIIVDPPRPGLSKKTKETLLESGASHIIYVSCNAAALKEDMKALQPSYTAEKIVPVDMFPHTRHVETVAVLKKRQGVA